MIRVTININITTRLAGTMCKICFVVELALKRAGVVLTFRTAYSAHLQEKLYTVRNVEIKPALIRDNTPRKSTFYIYRGYSYSSHHAKLQTPLKRCDINLHVYHTTHITTWVLPWVLPLPSIDYAKCTDAPTPHNAVICTPSLLVR